MRGNDELRHGNWNKDEQRYEDGCREDRPHPEGAATAADELRKRIQALRNNPEARQYFDNTFDAGLTAALHQVIAWSQEK